MHDIEQRIEQWRRELAGAGCHSDVVEELESHLREEVRRQVLSGETEEHALQNAINRLGSSTTLAAEFAKVVPFAPWWPIRIAYSLVFLLAVTLCLLILFRTRMIMNSATVLLQWHVVAITLGYVTTFLMGCLANCFVVNRLFRGLTPGQSRSLSLATKRLSTIATFLIAAGIVTGGIWAKIVWGRYWSWDIREIEACVLLAWMTTLSILALRHLVSVQVMMRAAIIGNILVAAAWFAPQAFYFAFQWNEIAGLTALLIFVAIQATFFAISLKPDRAVLQNA